MFKYIKPTDLHLTPSPEKVRGLYGSLSVLWLLPHYHWLHCSSFQNGHSGRPTDLPGRRCTARCRTSLSWQAIAGSSLSRSWRAPVNLCSQAARPFLFLANCQETACPVLHEIFLCILQAHKHMWLVHHYTETEQSPWPRHYIF